MSLQSALKVTLAAVAASVCTLGQTQAAEKVNVAVSFVGLWDTSQPSFCKDRGKFEEAGLDVEIVSTRGGSETVQGVIAGGMDIGYSPGTSAVLAAYSKGAEIRIVSSEFVGQNDSFFYVKADSPIKTVDDIAGKTVAFPRPGGSTEGVLLGLKAERKIDFTPVATGKLDATRTMVMTGQVDVGYSFPPYQLDGVVKGETRVIFAGDIVESQRNVSGRVNIATTKFVTERREVAKKFFSVLQECIDWAYANPDESLKLYADINKVSPEIAKIAREFYAREQLALKPIKGLDESIKRAVEAGFLDKPLTDEQVKTLVDLLD